MGTVLHDRVLGEGPDVVLLHGLFGQGSNLGSVARALQSHFRVHSLDLPDHGRSAWTRAPSIPSYVEAVAAWLKERKICRAHLLGHSLGGKVAMGLALAYPGLVDRLIVADIAPIAYQPSHDHIFEGLAAVSAARCASRSEADGVLANHVDEPGVRQFLLMSLAKTGPEQALDWRLNREGLALGYLELLAAVPGEASFDGDTLVIRGADSAYVRDTDMAAVRSLFPRSQLVTLANTGHWLHAEKPTEFNAQVMAFLG